MIPDVKRLNAHYIALQAKEGGERQPGVALFLMAAFELPGSLLFAALCGAGAAAVGVPALWKKK